MRVFPTCLHVVLTTSGHAPDIGRWFPPRSGSGHFWASWPSLELFGNASLPVHSGPEVLGWIQIWETWLTDDINAFIQELSTHSSHMWPERDHCTIRFYSGSLGFILVLHCNVDGGGLFDRSRIQLNELWQTTYSRMKYILIQHQLFQLSVISCCSSNLFTSADLIENVFWLSF